jgi:2-amino-4-hydroxy-6-hydroxymethyldihydropteridine diphosphokinase
MGKRERILLQAMTQLQKNSDEALLRSSLWETAPVNCPPGSPPFLNAVVGLALRRRETAESLLAKLQALEKSHGRKPKKILNEPRPLDLDLIAFGNETCNGKILTLPHPRARLRRFVLEPLSEIAPDLVLPGQSKTVSQLLCALPPDESLRKLKNPNKKSGESELELKLS